MFQGTPISNSVNDLHALVQFLRLEPFYGGESLFGRFFTRPLKNGYSGTKAMEKLQQLMGALAIRREKRKTLQGELMPKVEIIVSIKLSSDERKAYDTIHSAITSFVSYIRIFNNGNVDQNSSAVLACISRLRQCCCDMSMVPGDALARLLSSYKSSNNAVIERLSKGDLSNYFFFVVTLIFPLRCKAEQQELVKLFQKSLKPSTYDLNSEISGNSVFLVSAVTFITNVYLRRS